MSDDMRIDVPSVLSDINALSDLSDNVGTALASNRNVMGGIDKAFVATAQASYTALTNHWNTADVALCQRLDDLVASMNTAIGEYENQDTDTVEDLRNAAERA